MEPDVGCAPPSWPGAAPPGVDATGGDEGVPPAPPPGCGVGARTSTSDGETCCAGDAGAPSGASAAAGSAGADAVDPDWEAATPTVADVVGSASPPATGWADITAPTDGAGVAVETDAEAAVGAAAPVVAGAPGGTLTEPAGGAAGDAGVLAGEVTAVGPGDREPP